MADKTLSIFQDILNLLKADSVVSALCADRVYTDIPSNEVFPYIRVEMNDRENSTKSKTGLEHDVQISVFSREDTPEGVASIKAAVYDILNRQENAFSNSNINYINYVFGDLNKNEDGETWTAILQFEISAL